MPKSRRVEDAMQCMDVATCDVLKKSADAHLAASSTQFEARELRIATHKRKISGTIRFDPNELKKEPA